MHTGEDTARYLELGFDVVAVEANPDLVDAASTTFSDALETGQLKIVNAAISDARGTASFAVAPDHGFLLGSDHRNSPPRLSVG